MRRQIVPFHESLGIAVLALSVGRLAWRLINPPPPLNSTLSPWEKESAHAAHVLFYFMMIGMPLAGWAITSANKRSLTMHFYLIGPHSAAPHRTAGAAASAVQGDGPSRLRTDAQFWEPGSCWRCWWFTWRQP